MKTASGKSYREFRNKLTRGDKEREVQIQHESIRLDLAQVLYDYREEKGVTQKQLAHQMGVKQQVISRIESGSSNMTMETLMRFLEVLGIVLKVEAVKRKRAEKVLQFIEK